MWRLLKGLFRSESTLLAKSGVNIGWYGVAKRDLDHGGESLSMPFELPCSRTEVLEYCEQMDKLELMGNPNSGIRHFPTLLTDHEVQDYKKKRR